MPFKAMIRDEVTAYHTLDLWPRSEDTTYVGDIQDMHMIEDERYDAALCFEVLEHISNPGRAVREIYRILRPGGVAIISVPHLSRLHDEPHDYYRFTKYGLRHLFEAAGFVVTDIKEKGGLFSFLGHQASTLLLAALWPIPGLRQLAWFFNKWLLTWPCYGLDRVSQRSGIFALGYVSIIHKPDSIA
jgi:SAM-dependent methyltransferase